MDVEIDLTQATREMGALKDVLEDATPLFNILGQELELAIDDSFRDEVDPDGSPWAELSPRYLAYKTKKGLILKRNQAKGTTRSTITYRAYSDRLEVGANTPYSDRMQERRPFLYSEKGGLGRARERRIQDTADAFFQRLIRRK